MILLNILSFIAIIKVFTSRNYSAVLLSRYILSESNSFFRYRYHDLAFLLCNFRAITFRTARVISVPNDEMRLEAIQLTLVPYGVSGSYFAVVCVWQQEMIFCFIGLSVDLFNDAVSTTDVINFVMKCEVE